MSEIKTKLTADPRGAVTGFREVADEMRRQQTALKGIKDEVAKTRSAGREWLKDLKKGMIDLPFKAAAAGIRGIGSALSMSVRAANSLRKDFVATYLEARKIDVQFQGALENSGIGRARKELDAWILGLQRASNVGDEASKATMNFFAPFLEGNMEQRVAQLKQLTLLAHQMAASRGESVETAQQALGMLLSTGEARGLKKFGLGPSTMQAFEETKARGGDARGLVISELLRSTSGALGREREANPYGAIENAVGDIKEALGGGIVEAMRPYLTSLGERLQALSESLGAVQDWPQFLKDLWGEIKERGPTWIAQAKSVLSEAMAGLGEVSAGSVKLIVEGLRVGSIHLEHALMSGARKVLGALGVGGGTQGGLDALGLISEKDMNDRQASARDAHNKLLESRSLRHLMRSARLHGSEAAAVALDDIMDSRRKNTYTASMAIDAARKLGMPNAEFQTNPNDFNAAPGLTMMGAGATRLWGAAGQLDDLVLSGLAMVNESASAAVHMQQRQMARESAAAVGAYN